LLGVLSDLEVALLFWLAELASLVWVVWSAVELVWAVLLLGTAARYCCLVLLLDTAA